LAPHAAVRAAIAGGAIGRYDPHAWLPAVVDIRTNRDDLSGELVTEWRRYVLHDRRMAAAKCLQVGPAGQRPVNTDDDLTAIGPGHRNIFDPHVTWGIEHCRLHQIILLLILVRPEISPLTGEANGA
jgi:hypothetical protein